MRHTHKQRLSVLHFTTLNYLVNCTAATLANTHSTYMNVKEKLVPSAEIQQVDGFIEEAH